MLHGSLDQSISPYKSHLRNPKKVQYHPFMSMPSEILLQSHFHLAGAATGGGGLLQAPPPFHYQSYPPYSLQQSRQPPLLPLPAANPRRSAATRGLFCPPVNKKTTNTGNRSRDSSLTPKKPKSPTKNSSPKKIVPVKTFSGTNTTLRSMKGVEHDNDHELVNMFSGAAAFAISPPPSSLPLPTFSLRPKLSCNAQAAAGIDTGATDNLRRLLRLP